MRFFGCTYSKASLFAVLFSSSVVIAQTGLERDPFPGKSPRFQLVAEEPHVSINQLSNLSFGAFYPGKSGGSIEINPDGVRSAVGSVILLHSELNPSAAVFEIKCPSNTSVHIVIDQQIVLQDATGQQLLCEPLLSESDYFISPENAEAGFLYRVGAKVDIPPATYESAFSYSGTLSIMLILE